MRRQRDKKMWVLSAVILAALGPAAFPKEKAPAPRWIENQLDRGIQQARTTGKPLLILFRCPP